ncbi:hypothetical protein GH141_08955, partial [bacterium]|nr:hypothetical protein [bacterium]
MTVLAVAAQSFELHLVGGLWLGNPWDYPSLWTLVAVELVAVRENLADTEVMMITGYATVEGAVQAVKQGAE